MNSSVEPLLEANLKGKNGFLDHYTLPVNVPGVTASVVSTYETQKPSPVSNFTQTTGRRKTTALCFYDRRQFLTFNGTRNKLDTFCCVQTKTFKVCFQTKVWKS